MAKSADWRKAWPAKAKAYNRWQRGLKTRATHWINGCKLRLKQREHVLREWVYRWTYDNPRRVWAWTRAGRLWGIPMPTLPLISDKEWLARHSFPLVGMARFGLYCRPVQSYPQPLLSQQKAGNYTMRCLLEQ